MMRVCHLDTCPVGVATQNPELRKKFSGKPEFVVNFFEFIAEEVREYLAALGFRSLEEAIGHVEMLDTRQAIDHWKAHGLDLSPILAAPINKYEQTFFRSRGQDHGLDQALDNELIADAAAALERRRRGEARRTTIQNTNRTVGTMLGAELTRRWGGEGLPDGTIDVTFHGSAGQSFGAFVPARHHAAARGRRQRLLRQGPLGRHARAASAARRRRSSPRRTSSPATSSSTARPAATCSSAVSSASGSACATPARPRSSKASATTAAST